MPVPVHLDNVDDGLPTITSDTSGGFYDAFKAALPTLGFNIDSDDSGTQSLVFSNNPLNDIQYFIRLDSEFPEQGTTSSDVEVGAARLEVYQSLGDATAQTNIIRTIGLRLSSRGSTVSGTPSRYKFIGDGRTLYFLNNSSAADPESPIYYLTTLFEMAKGAGLPGASIAHGVGLNPAATSVNSFYAAVASFDSGGDTYLLSGVGTGVTETPALAVTLPPAGNFDNEANSNFGTISALPDMPLSPIYLWETGTTLRGSFPGLLAPIGAISGLADQTHNVSGVQSQAGFFNGILCRMTVRSTRAASAPNHWKVFDLTNDWDLYHAA